MCIFYSCANQLGLLMRYTVINPCTPDCKKRTAGLYGATRRDARTKTSGWGRYEGWRRNAQASTSKRVIYGATRLDAPTNTSGKGRCVVCRRNADASTNGWVGCAVRRCYTRDNKSGRGCCGALRRTAYATTSGRVGCGASRPNACPKKTSGGALERDVETLTLGRAAGLTVVP